MCYLRNCDKLKWTSIKNSSVFIKTRIINSCNCNLKVIRTNELMKVLVRYFKSENARLSRSAINWFSVVHGWLILPDCTLLEHELTRVSLVPQEVCCGKTSCRVWQLLIFSPFRIKWLSVCLNSIKIFIGVLFNGWAAAECLTEVINGIITFLS